MKYFILAFKKWNDINGRANLREYWYYVLFNYIFWFTLVLIDVIIFVDDVETATQSDYILSTIFSLISFLPSLTLTVRRYHDVNKSGWNLLWALTIIGLLYLFILTLLKGSEKDNHYGAPSNA